MLDMAFLVVFLTSNSTQKSSKMGPHGKSTDCASDFTHTILSKPYLKQPPQTKIRKTTLVHQTRKQQERMHGFLDLPKKPRKSKYANTLRKISKKDLKSKKKDLESPLSSRAKHSFANPDFPKPGSELRSQGSSCIALIKCDSR